MRDQSESAKQWWWRNNEEEDGGLWRAIIEENKKWCVWNKSTEREGEREGLWERVGGGVLASSCSLEFSSLESGTAAVWVFFCFTRSLSEQERHRGTKADWERLKCLNNRLRLSDFRLCHSLEQFNHLCRFRVTSFPTQTDKIQPENQKYETYTILKITRLSSGI